jgi:hypothetical protein
MSATHICPHFNFAADVKVARIEDTGMKYADLTIVCTDCGKPAQFRGLSFGLTPHHPTVSVDRQEARLPFLCEGDAFRDDGLSYSLKVSS